MASAAVAPANRFDVAWTGSAHLPVSVARVPMAVLPPDEMDRPTPCLYHAFSLTDAASVKNGMWGGAPRALFQRYQTVYADLVLLIYPMPSAEVLPAAERNSLEGCAWCRVGKTELLRIEDSSQMARAIAAASAASESAPLFVEKQPRRPSKATQVMEVAGRPAPRREAAPRELPPFSADLVIADEDALTALATRARTRGDLTPVEKVRLHVGRVARSWAVPLGLVDARFYDMFVGHPDDTGFNRRGADAVRALERAAVALKTPTPELRAALERAAGAVTGKRYDTALDIAADKKVASAALALHAAVLLDMVEPRWRALCLAGYQPPAAARGGAVAPAAPAAPQAAAEGGGAAAAGGELTGHGLVFSDAAMLAGVRRWAGTYGKRGFEALAACTGYRGSWDEFCAQLAAAPQQPPAAPAPPAAEPEEGTEPAAAAPAGPAAPAAPGRKKRSGVKPLYFLRKALASGLGAVLEVGSRTRQDSRVRDKRVSMEPMFAMLDAYRPERLLKHMRGPAACMMTPDSDEEPPAPARARRPRREPPRPALLPGQTTLDALLVRPPAAASEGEGGADGDGDGDAPGPSAAPAAAAQEPQPVPEPAPQPALRQLKLDALVRRAAPAHGAAQLKVTAAERGAALALVLPKRRKGGRASSAAEGSEGEEEGDEGEGEGGESEEQGDAEGETNDEDSASPARQRRGSGAGSRRAAPVRRRRSGAAEGAGR